MYNGRRLAKPNQGTIEIRLSRHQTTSPQTKSPLRSRLAVNNAVSVRDMKTQRKFSGNRNIVILLRTCMNPPAARLKYVSLAKRPSHHKQNRHGEVDPPFLRILHAAPNLLLVLGNGKLPKQNMDSMCQLRFTYLTVICTVWVDFIFG